MMDSDHLALRLAAATGLQHAVEAPAPGLLRITPIGFQPGAASYHLLVERTGFRNRVTVQAAPFAGRLLTSIAERMVVHADEVDALRTALARADWDLKSVPVEGSPELLVVRENGSLVTEPVPDRDARLVEVCVLVTTFMLGSLAVTRQPADTRPARPRDEAVAENISWVYDPAERDRATSVHRRLENWLMGMVAEEGLKPLDPDGAVEFDLAWVELDGSLSICEVKSTSGHENGQLRLGFGQILHYAAQTESTWEGAINAVLFVEAEPKDRRWRSLCSDHGVLLAWPASWEIARTMRRGAQSEVGKSK